MRAGVSDVIDTPLDERRSRRPSSSSLMMSSSGSQLHPHRKRLPAPKKGRIITVMSAKGGSGKTVLATNLALLLNRLPDKKVVPGRRRPPVR
jgi:Flp pilus assembly CpaE family ATPase